MGEIVAGSSSPSFHRLARRITLRIVALYLVLGFTYIALSDRVVIALVDDPRVLTWVQTFKGWGYVAVTGVLLYGLIFWQTRRIAAANEALAERDRHITRLNRVYAMLSAINGAILRGHDQDALLDEVAHIAVDKGGFPLAWVGLVDADQRTLRPVASAGAGLDCLDGLVLHVDPDHPEAHAMAADLARGHPFVINDLAETSPVDKCHARAVAHGYRALAVVPILKASRLLGVIGLFTREAPDRGGPVFDDDELRLLTEIAADTGLGMTLIAQATALDWASRFDVLTGLANRDLLKERIDQALLRARHQRRYVGVLAMEVAGLRAVVDSLGRQQGDRLLQAVAQRLAGQVREGDTVAALGNGEFAVLLADVREGLDVADVAHKLLKPFELELQADAPPHFVTLAAGAAVYPNDADTADGLIHCAGIALHQGGAQAPTGDCVFYAPEMDQRVREYQALDNELLGALERGEMQLHYQPVVRLETGEIIGVEALLRWHNRRFGAVSPDRFIPMAEHSGVIRPLGDWVLEQACARLARWQERGWRLRMSVNLSTRQLLAPGFAERIRETIMRHRLDAERMVLALEVTETAVIEDMEAVSEALARVKDLGIAVHLDDFGTGYASLSYLHRLPVDTIKIDKSFVQTLDTDPVAENLVRSVIALARSLNMGVVAEGVETAEQRDALKALGCHVAQGYLFARPQPAEDVERLLEASNP